MYIFCNCRQVDPAKKSFVTKTLSDNQNSINMRKVQINAQVTAIISSLEVFGNVTVIILLAVTKGTSLLSLMHNMVFYAVLIPRLFLMNTSHNKNRIVEKGWKNIMKNLIGRANNSIQDNAIVPSEENKMLKRHRKRRIYPNKSMDIFTVEIPMEITNASAINPALKQGPSHGKVQPTRYIPGRNSESLDLQDLEEVEENERMSKLVVSMLTEIRDEQSYISYFKQMITHIDFRRTGKRVSACDLEHEFSTTSKRRDVYRKAKGKKMQQVGACASNKLVEHSSLAINIESRKNGAIDARKINLQKNQENIILKRSNILNKISMALDKKESHGLLVDQLIDLEEHFVQRSER